MVSTGSVLAVGLSYCRCPDAWRCSSNPLQTPWLSRGQCLHCWFAHWNYHHILIYGLRLPMAMKSTMFIGEMVASHFPITSSWNLHEIGLRLADLPCDRARLLPTGWYHFAQGSYRLRLRDCGASLVVWETEPGKWRYSPGKLLLFIHDYRCEKIRTQHVLTALNQSEKGGFNGGNQLIWPMGTHWILDDFGHVEIAYFTFQVCRIQLVTYIIVEFFPPSSWVEETWNTGNDGHTTVIACMSKT